ncbi:hypothetical protein SVI_3606 [Shewanella violacea DSS12]|uniref:Uncharacterized protein n=1 Tax=Shewanella violacea (strain JCM 10179 / CIP 106290 / LMG 19151 / DSS12) TaxID=637905 RepID=D4ZC32_SHEVD|nr:hypothetical protein SVI_3606 [Shewanella violacea DSS12]
MAWTVTGRASGEIATRLDFIESLCGAEDESA